MPWTPAEMKKKKHDLTAAEAKKAAAIANGILLRTGDDAQALRIAMGRINDARKSKRKR